MQIDLQTYLQINLQKKRDMRITNKNTDIVQKVSEVWNLVEAGKFDLAENSLKPFWRGVGEYPLLEDTPELLQAELLLITGSLSGWMGSTEQIDGAQEKAKDMISESSGIFEDHQIWDKWADARGELALCYWREGAFSEARIILQDALSRISGDFPDVAGKLLLRLVNVEISTYNYENAHSLLSQADKVIKKAKNNFLLCGKLYFHYALVLRRLATEENKPDYLNKALDYYLKSKDYYQKADHKLYEAMVDNNLGYLFLKSGTYEKAHQHLDKALNYFSAVDDKGRTSLAYDNKARVFLAQENLIQAEKNAKIAVDLIKEGDEQSSQAEYLITLGIIKARRKNINEARDIFLQASEIAYAVGDAENGGLALLTLIEELREDIAKDKLIEYYLRAGENLSKSFRESVIQRLNQAAGYLLRENPRLSNNSELANSQDSSKETVVSEEQYTFIGTTSNMKEIIETAENLAEMNKVISITGEPGTGKKTLARYIHHRSGKKGNFVIINCALSGEVTSDSLIFPRSAEMISDLSDKVGSLFESGLGDTLYLEQVDKLNVYEQSRLMTALENRPSNVWIIASFGSMPEDLVERGILRQDLFYKLTTFQLSIPPLRNRKDDIKAIAEQMITNNFPDWVNKLDENFFNFLISKPLYGNGYELKSILENTIWCLENNRLPKYSKEDKFIKSVKPNIPENWNGFSLPLTIKNFESEIIYKALEDSGRKITKASEMLGISHQNLSSLLKNRHKELSAKKKSRKKRVSG